MTGQRDAGSADMLKTDTSRLLQYLGYDNIHPQPIL